MVWKSYTVLEEPVPTRKNAAGIQEFGPAGAAVSSSPSIDAKRQVLYVATGGTGTGLEQSLTDAVVAFDLADGKLRWVKQLSRPDASGFGSRIYQFAGAAQPRDRRSDFIGRTEVGHGVRSRSRPRR